MLSACYLTALGALFWLLIRRAVDQCEAKGDLRFFCYIARNSEEFLAHFTLVAATFALASLALIIGMDSGIVTLAFLSAVEAFLVQVQLGIQGAGLSTWSTAAILTVVYLLHLIRLPEDVEFRRFPRALKFIRRPARVPGIRSTLHTGVYLIALITASAVFFASQAGALTQIVSMRLAAISTSAGQNVKETERETETETEEAMEAALAKYTADDLIDQSVERIQSLEDPISEQREDRQRARQEEAGHRKKENLKRLTDFRAKAMNRLKGVELTVKETPGTSTSGLVNQTIPVNPYVHNERFLRRFATRQRPVSRYPRSAYYRGRPGRGGAVARQRLQPLYPGLRAYYPERRTDSGQVKKKSLDADKLIDAVHSDLESIEDPLKQERAIDVADELFSQSPSTDLEFFRKVETFAKETLPADGAAALLISSYTARNPGSDKRSVAPVSTPFPPARPPVLLYPWHGPSYPPGLRPPR